MGFLDNLENTLKNAERTNDREDDMAATLSRAAELQEIRAAAPHAEALRNGKWTQDLLTHCVTIGHGQRVRVGMTWIGTTLRLDAREKRLDLQPNAQGILGIFSVDGAITALEPIDLNSDAEALARKWLAT